MPKLSEEKKQIMDRIVKERVFKEASALLKQEKAQLFTMEELARAVGVSKGTLYNYFTDKKEVILFISETITAQLIQDLEQLFIKHPDNYPLTLQEVYRFFLVVMKKYRYMNSAMLAFSYETLMTGGSMLLDFLPTQKIRPCLESFFARGIAHQAFKPTSPAALTIYFGSTLRGLNLATYYAQLDAALQDSQLQEELEKLLLEAICLK